MAKFEHFLGFDQKCSLFTCVTYFILTLKPMKWLMRKYILCFVEHLIETSSQAKFKFLAFTDILFIVRVRRFAYQILAAHNVNLALTHKKLHQIQK